MQDLGLQVYSVFQFNHCHIYMDLHTLQNDVIPALRLSLAVVRSVWPAVLAVILT